MLCPLARIYAPEDVFHHNPASGFLYLIGCGFPCCSHPLGALRFFNRRFKSEVQQCSIDDMAERTAGETCSEDRCRSLCGEYPVSACGV
jgi:hypothetical protein